MSDLSAETQAARAGAVDTDVERDNYFLEELIKHREKARQDPKTQKRMAMRAALGDRILDLPLFSKQRGLDIELKRLHPSRTKRCSDDLDAKAAEAGITFEHIGITIGTIIHGPDLSKEQPQHVIDTIKQALLERKVVFFRDQKLTREQHLAFGARFGPLEVHPFAPGLAGYPEILPIKHDVADRQGFAGAGCSQRQKEAAATLFSWHYSMTQKLGNSTTQRIL